MENDPPPAHTPGPAVKPGRPLIQAVIATVVGVLVALVLVGFVARARMLKLETESTNKLKQMGLGFQNFDSAQSALPARAFLQRESEIPRSWRWSILPYMEQDAYFNAKEAAKRASMYYTPPEGDPTSMLTPYKVFDFKNGIFDPLDPPIHNRSQWTVARLTSTPRGTSNLIFCIEANDAVEWSKPGDIHYDPNGPLPELKPLLQRSGWLVLMGDGSTKFIRTSVSESALRAAIDPASSNLEELP